MNNTLFIALQHCLPQHALSRAAGWLADTEIPWIKNAFGRWFIKRFNVDLTEAEKPSIEQYACFNDFFTRALKPGARPISDAPNAIVSPADGAVSEVGKINDGTLVQAKNHRYSVCELLGGDASLADNFIDGDFLTVYLSPKDYHRLHMPIAGTLRTMIHVPGDLFSVNQTTAEGVPNLFARNERVVCIFDSDAGPFALVLVGAMIVASIETVWAGLITPQKKQPRVWDYSGKTDISLAKGEEMGRFKLGSTIVVVTPKGFAEYNPSLAAGSVVRMGEAIGSCTN